MPEPKPKPKTGFCSIGHHEGGRYPGPSGKLNKTCTFYETCGCDCHDTFNRMFEASGMPRQVVDNSGFAPDHHQFVLPEPVIVESPSPLSSSGVVIPPNALESAAPGIVAPARPQTFKPTASGRAARGELESWIKTQCDIWLVEKHPWPCTAAWVSDEIARTEGIKAPSTGAIVSAWIRWQRYGFATVQTKPWRFTGYTEEGIQLGLEALKARAKRAEKSQEAALRRGEKV